MEVAQKRIPKRGTLRNPDGSYPIEVFTKPIHYRDGSGLYQAIQYALVAETNGSRLNLPGTFEG